MATMTKPKGKTKDGRTRWIKPDSQFPDFELPDENGVMHKLSELQGDDVLVFDPVRVIDGIELSDDPLPMLRSQAYSISVERRTGAKRPAELG